MKSHNYFLEQNEHKEVRLISKNPSKLHHWTTMKTEAAIVSQMSIIIYQSPECNTPEDMNLHQHHCRNLKYHMMYFWQKLYFCLTFVLASPFPSNGKDFISKNVLITGGFPTYILKSLKSRILFQPLLTCSSSRILKNCYLSPLLFC